MVPARELRDCDLAINLLSTSKQAEAGGLLAELERQRKEAEHILLGTLRRWMERKSSLKWRTKLQSAFAARKKTLPETAHQAAAELLPELAKEFFDRGKQAMDAGEFHQFRGAWLERIRRVQALAGSIDDCASVRKRVDGAVDVDIALEKRQRQRVEEFQREWTQGFASPAQAREWIHYLQYFSANRHTARKPMARSVSAAGLSRPRSRQA